MTTNVYNLLFGDLSCMVTYQKSMQIIALLSFLIFIPSLGYAESLSEMARQLDIENLEKIKHVSATVPDTIFFLLTPMTATIITIKPSMPILT